MKLVALMAFYDEPPEMLHDSITSLDPHIDYMIAVDGSYPYYPGGTTQSPKEQHEAIRTALEGHRIGWEIITPGRLWADEAEKRTYMFTYASYRTTNDDWYLIWDADFFLKRCQLVHERLSTTPYHVATVDLRSSPASREPEQLAHRLLFRAHRDMYCDGRHNIYAIRGREPESASTYLWGHDEQVRAADLTNSVRIWHDPGRRPDARMASRSVWHDAQGRLEAQFCAS